MYCYKNAILLSGITRVYTNDSIIKKEYEYKNGLLTSKSGFFRKYNTISYKSELDSLGNYIRTYIYNKQGKLISYTEYKNGIRDGIYKQYYKNGILQLECNYINGKKEGLFICYSESGEKCRETEYKNGKKIK